MKCKIKKTIFKDSNLEVISFVYVKLWKSDSWIVIKDSDSF